MTNHSSLRHRQSWGDNNAACLQTALWLKQQMGFCDSLSGSRQIPDTAVPCHTLVLAPGKRKSLRVYTASAKPDFTAERSPVSRSAPSERYYRGHQGAGSCSSRSQVALQDNVLHREAPWLLSCSSVINGHKYLITHTHSTPWPWPRPRTALDTDTVWMCVCVAFLQGSCFSSLMS